MSIGHSGAISFGGLTECQNPDIIILTQGKRCNGSKAATPLTRTRSGNGKGAMTFQVTPQGIKVEMNFIQNTVPVVNVFHVDNGGSVDATSLHVVALIFSDYWTALRVNLSVSLVLQNITVTDISVADGIQEILTGFADPEGAVTSAAAAANAACCISLRTAHTGRSFRGRSYVGGINAVDLFSAQTLTTTFAAALASHMQDLIDALIAAGKTLCVLSRYADKVLRVVGLLTEIISIIVDTKVDSQRRRTAN